MITYTLICKDCRDVEVVTCSIKEHETKIKPGTPCDCGGRHRQVIEGGGGYRMRTPFPKGDYEQFMPGPDFKPAIFRDKKEAMGQLEEHGLQSNWCENDM